MIQNRNDLLLKGLIQITRKNVILIVVPVIMLVVLIGIFKLTSQNTIYDLQLGKKTSDEFPKIIDKGTDFQNNSTLIALAIFPDKDYKKNLMRAQLYVTRKGDTNELQKEYIRVTEDLAAHEMRLDNLKWPPGEYTIYFKTGSELVKSVDFSLR